MRNVESSVEQGNPRCLKKAVFTGERRRSIMSVRTVSSCLALAWTFLSLQALAADAAPQASEIWQKVRTSLFESRPIRTDADAIIQLEAPTRAEDASVVPISIKTRLILYPAGYIYQYNSFLYNIPPP